MRVMSLTLQRRPWPESAGSAAVEFALIVPLLVIMTFGIVEASQAVNRSQGMQAAAREGARFAAVERVTVEEIETRVRATLQHNGGGSGFPAPGGTLDEDIQVGVWQYDSDEDPDDGDAGTRLVASDAVPCPSTAGGESVRVAAWVASDRTAEYGLSVPLLPPYPLDLRAEAVFPCLP